MGIKRGKDIGVLSGAANLRPAFGKALSWSWRCVSPVVDPIQTAIGLKHYRHYVADWRKYAQLPGAEIMKLSNAFPQLHDRTTKHSIDAHYFYTNAWAMRRIVANKPIEHVDVGSHISVASLLSAFVPVTFVDYRPLEACLPGLTCIGGDILSMPFMDGSIGSLSCLHVAEHIGLGRYGDPLDPKGSEKAAQEMARVLAPGGDLFFVVPVGKPRLCFNAHRIHSPETIRDYFAELELVEFSGVDDNGRFVEHASLTTFKRSIYACGMFWFHKSVC